MNVSHSEVFWTHTKTAGFIVVLADGSTSRFELNKSQWILDLFGRGNDFVIDSGI